MSDHTKLLSQLRQALAHLDDPLYLESLDLARQISMVAQSPDLSKGQNLRRALHLAIAALDPGQNHAPPAVEPRSYRVLCRYAIAKQSMVAIARQLDISQRQAYRELYRGIEALARILSDLAPSAKLIADIAPSPVGSQAAKVRAELERLAGAEAQDIDLGALLAGVVEGVRALAEERRVVLQLSDDTTGLHVATNRVLLRQAILNLLSHMVSTHQGEIVRVVLQCTERGAAKPLNDAAVRMRYRPAATPDVAQSESPYAMAVQLINTLGLRWTDSPQPDGDREVAIYVPLVRRHSVLVVDDNEGVIALFARYLRHQPFSLVGAHDYREALAKLDEVRPEAIILDVMLPNQDGWEVLQALRAHPLGKHARIIICSIINDPQLARALGADAFLHKPVDRQSLLQALELVLASDARP
jgi:CheY-like chemotaxis protein